MAFENHATSKLKNADGLFDIRTLGFRGEALPSIAAVSHVTMTTRTKDAEAGAKVEIEGGRFIGVSETRLPGGHHDCDARPVFQCARAQGVFEKAGIRAGLD